MEIAHLGKGFYHVFLWNPDHQSLFMIMGTQSLKPEILRVSWLVRDSNLHNWKQTNTQCWVHIYDLPMEYRGTINLMNIERGVGIPLKVDPSKQRTGSFSRVQVDVDCSMDLPTNGLCGERKQAITSLQTHTINFYRIFIMHVEPWDEFSELEGQGVKKRLKGLPLRKGEQTCMHNKMT